MCVCVCVYACNYEIIFAQANFKDVVLFQVLRLLYHRSRKFSDVEIYFTLLTIMVLRHFPDRIDLVLSFVTDLKEAEVRNSEGKSCFVPPNL